MKEITTQIFTNGMEIIGTGRFIGSSQTDTVIHLDPEDKDGGKFKIILRFKNEENAVPSVNGTPLEDGSPHGLILELINFLQEQSAGLYTPLRVAMNEVGELYFAFAVHGLTNDDRHSKAIDYTFYKKVSDGRQEKAN